MMDLPDTTESVDPNCYMAEARQDLDEPSYHPMSAFEYDDR